MSKILVIADDLTGAAEIGGIAYQAGFSVRIILDFLDSDKFDEDVIIIDSNTRHLSAEYAHLKIKTILQTLYLPEYDLVFKKIDSVLRGNIEPEIQTFFSQTFFDSALLIPSNPTKQRTIKNGKYFIDSVPINETDFRLDPEYPRKSKTVKKLFANETTEIVTRNGPPDNWLGKLFIPDISSLKDVEKYAAQNYNNKLLFVGGADFFKSLLSKKTTCTFHNRNISNIGPSVQKSFIMGSNSESSLQTLSLLSAKKYSIFHLSQLNLKSENQFLKWTNSVITEFKRGKNIAITTPTEFIRKHSRRIKITKALVEAACQIMANSTTSKLFFVEGGETASSFFRNLGWRELVVRCNFEGGTVMLLNEKANREVIIKPGSYKWPKVITEKL